MSRAPRYTVHVLTRGFDTPNGSAFLFPLIAFRHALAQAGYVVKLFFSTSPDLLNCDVLLVDSKFHRDRWQMDTPAVLAEFQRFAEAGPRIVYCDTTDSTGGLMVQLLPIVDVYAKAQLLAERSAYLGPHYGLRVYTDHYFRTANAQDSDPIWSSAVPDPALLDRLALSWNSGLADYSQFGPARMALYRRFPLRRLLTYPRGAATAERERPLDLQARMGTRYNRSGVSYHRQSTLSALGTRVQSGKLGRNAYWREMTRTKLIVSPFGLGEITLKDFEAFLAGGCLVKPDMRHLETWPDLYRCGETIGCFSWDFDDVEAVIDSLIEDPERRIAIARTGQRAYRKHIDPQTGGELFAAHFAGLIERAMAARRVGTV